jgi:hypothetical protein
MPRQALSAEEKKQRNAAKLAQWRARIAQQPTTTTPATLPNYQPFVQFSGASSSTQQRVASEPLASREAATAALLPAPVLYPTASASISIPELISVESLPVHPRLPTRIPARQQRLGLDPLPQGALESQSPHLIPGLIDKEPEDAFQNENDTQPVSIQDNSNNRESNTQDNSDQSSLAYDSNSDQSSLVHDNYWGGDDDGFQDSGFRGETQPAVSSLLNSRKRSEIRSEPRASPAPSRHRTPPDEAATPQESPHGSDAAIQLVDPQSLAIVDQPLGDIDAIARLFPANHFPGLGVFVDDQPDSNHSSDEEFEPEWEDTDSDIEAEQEEAGDEADAAAQLQAELQAADELQTDYPAELARQILRFQGCTHAEHTDLLTRSRAQHEAENHVTIRGLIDFLQAANIPGFFADRLPTAVERAAVPLPDWKAAFEGKVAGEDSDSEHSEDEAGSDHESNGSGSEPNREETRPNVCVSCSQTDHASAAIQYDFDSFLGWAHSLAFARQGLLFNFTPRFHDNIKTDLHLYMQVSDFTNPDRPKQLKVKLHRVPHICLGRVISQEGISVYIFFPRMWEPTKETNFPGRGDGEPSALLRHWTDLILLPALKRNVSPTSRQHLPFDWEHARGKAEAYSREQSGGGDDGSSGIKSKAMHYELHPLALAPVWQDIQQRLTDPVHQIFSDARIFFSSKNTKLRFSYPSLSAAWDAFRLPLSSALNFAYIDRAQAWADLGKETVATEYAETEDQLLAGDSRPVTYLMRTCCQAAFARWANASEPGRSAKPTFYTTAMLRDATDMTVEMSQSSQKRLQGWVFSQAYNSYKELYDAGKTKPFSTKFLTQLARDTDVDKMLRQQGKGAAKEMRKIFKTYFASKTRLFSAMRGALRHSFGVREEHRLSLAFIDRLKEHMQSGREWESIRDRIDDDYDSFWELLTDDWIAYLSQNVHKYTSAFEWIRTSHPKGRVSYEHCKVMIMLLKALPFTFDTGLVKDKSEIWQDTFQRAKSGRIVLGMGMQEALTTCGYGWIMPRLDWERLAFRYRFAHKVAFADNAMRDEYRKNWKVVVNSKNDYTRIEAADQWLARFGDADECCDYIEIFMLIHIMRAYRKEVFKHISHLVKPESREEAESGKILLCESWIREHFVDDWEANISIININRTKIRTIQDLVELLWGFGDSIERGSWDKAPFRTFCQRALEIIEAHYGVASRNEYHELIGRYFIASHWMIPYPTRTKFIQRNHRNIILWISIYHRKLAYKIPDYRRLIAVSAFLPTTENYPTIHKPKWEHTLLEEQWRISREEAWERQVQQHAAYKQLAIEQNIPNYVLHDGNDIVREPLPRLTERWHMFHWGFSHYDKGPFMRQFPVDFTNTRNPFDSDLTSITTNLELAWRTWQQGEHPDED